MTYETGIAAAADYLDTIRSSPPLTLDELKATIAAFLEAGDPVYVIDTKAADDYDSSYTNGLPDPIHFLICDGVLVPLRPEGDG